MRTANSVGDVYFKIAEALSEGKRVALASVIRTEGSTPRGQGAKMLIYENGETFGTIGGGCVERYVVEEASQVFADGRLRIVECDLGDDSWSGIGMACGGKVEMAIELIEVKPKIVILGSGHIAKAVAKIASLTGFTVKVVDYVAKREDFPEADDVIGFGSPGGYLKELSNLKVNSNDSIVIVTRHNSDEEALRSALKSGAGYIGMVGSRNRVGPTFKSLINEGISEKELLKVHTPIGLDIGAETPEEIAVSIIAEIIMVRRGRGGVAKMLKDTVKPQVTGENPRSPKISKPD